MTISTQRNTDCTDRIPDAISEMKATDLSPTLDGANEGCVDVVAEG